MNSACKECMLNKHLNNYPEGAPEELVREYQETLVRITDQTGAVPTGPEVFYEVKGQGAEEAPVWRGRDGLRADQTSF